MFYEINFHKPYELRAESQMDKHFALGVFNHVLLLSGAIGPQVGS